MQAQSPAVGGAQVDLLAVLVVVAGGEQRLALEEVDRLGEARAYVGRLIVMFENALDTQDPRISEQARTDLLKALDEIEGETWL